MPARCLNTSAMAGHRDPPIGVNLRIDFLVGGVCNPDLISLGSQNRGYKPAKCQKAHLALIHSHKRQSGNYVLKLTPMGHRDPALQGLTGFIP